MITFKKLHEVEMDLIYLFDEDKLTKRHIIDHFTNLISEVRNG